jgi:hypothetical protein
MTPPNRFTLRDGKLYDKEDDVFLTPEQSLIVCNLCSIYWKQAWQMYRTAVQDSTGIHLTPAFEDFSKYQADLSNLLQE